jgi:hypothetical protein
MFECKICGEKMTYLMSTYSGGEPKTCHWCQNDGTIVTYGRGDPVWFFPIKDAKKKSTDGE